MLEIFEDASDAGGVFVWLVVSFWVGIGRVLATQAHDGAWLDLRLERRA